MKRKILVLDTETGGFDASRHSLLSLAAVLLDEKGEPMEEMYTLINEGEHLITEDSALRVNGLTMEKIRTEGITPLEAATQLRGMLRKHSLWSGVTIAAHNAPFDVSYLQRLWRLVGWDYKKQFSFRHLCTHTGALLLDQAGVIDLPGGSASLDTLVKYFDITLDRSEGHNALLDARAAAEVLRRLMEIIHGD